MNVKKTLDVLLTEELRDEDTSTISKKNLYEWCPNCLLNFRLATFGPLSRPQRRLFTNGLMSSSPPILLCLGLMAPSEFAAS